MITFAIERNGALVQDLTLNTRTDGFNSNNLNDVFDREEFQDFVNESLDIADEIFGENTDLNDTTIIQIGDDGYFNWGIKVSEDASGMLSIESYDWRTDGNKFRFVDNEKEN